jgi:hypothetical protein
VHAVAPGKSCNEVLLVLADAAEQVARDADVENAIALAGEDIYARCFHDACPSRQGRASSLTGEYGAS